MKPISRWSKQADRSADRRHAKQLAALLQAVLESPGATDPAVRHAVYRGESQSAPVGAYVEQIRSQSYRIGDEDVQRLLASGLSQDAVFELTVAAALGAAAERLEAGLRAMHAMREGR
jgi:alkylhydroperoxidase family enzyme